MWPASIGEKGEDDFVSSFGFGFGFSLVFFVAQAVLSTFGLALAILSSVGGCQPAGLSEDGSSSGVTVVT